jgi:glycosyltransferase involved in cell wall biosynthesis
MKEGRRSIRVAIFEPFGNLYGSERSMLDLLNSLPPKAIKPIVYCPKNAPWLAEIEKSNVSYSDWFELDLHKKSRLRRVVALLKFLIFLVKERIDVMHVNQLGAAAYGLAAGALLGLPLVVHSRWHEDAEAINSWRGNLGSLRKIICISGYQRTLLESQLESHIDKLIVIRNPYQLRLAGDRHVGAEEGVPVFVCVARLHPHKRQDLLIRAANRYLKEYGSCLVRFIGEEAQGSGYDDTLKSMAQDLGLRNSVQFLGYKSESFEYVRNATAMVLPSDFEALGRVVFEAWDAGAIPIAWRGSGGPAESIGRADGGVLYSDQTPEALAAAMFEAATLDEKRRMDMIDNGLKWLQENCAPESHAHSIINVWIDALAKG